jgi:hypothetical protein
MKEETPDVPEANGKVNIIYEYKLALVSYPAFSLGPFPIRFSGPFFGGTDFPSGGFKSGREEGWEGE